ncbi:hypothetical protein TELCIR_22834 [Teladorsagia circumcincta]|uniref:Uncharacterized protein n=1 Tax=Teladorsagia circumcincta TaxID=45464 RepID=A0A2G9TD16_TELCI|nr:hypothetical protein TELCIR_22834 [Teladorsagia circumcincta]
MPKDPRYTFTLFKCKVFALQMVNYIATYDHDSCTHLDTLNKDKRRNLPSRNVDPLSRCDKKAGWQELGARIFCRGDHEFQLLFKDHTNCWHFLQGK